MFEILGRDHKELGSCMGKPSEASVHGTYKGLPHAPTEGLELGGCLRTSHQQVVCLGRGLLLRQAEAGHFKGLLLKLECGAWALST